MDQNWCKRRNMFGQ